MSDEPRQGDEEPRFDEIFAKVRARRKPGPANPTKPRAVWPVVLVVAAIGGSGWLLAQKLREDARIQDCVMSGRKNCAHIEDPGEH